MLLPSGLRYLVPHCFKLREQVVVLNFESAFKRDLLQAVWHHLVAFIQSFKASLKLCACWLDVAQSHGAPSFKFEIGRNLPDLL